MPKKRLRLEWSSCKVVEHHIVVRCFMCQRFGHFANDCKSEVDVCGHCCKEGHRYKNCPESKDAPRYEPCQKAKRKHNHRVHGKDCAGYQIEVDHLKKNIDYE